MSTSHYSGPGDHPLHVQSSNGAAIAQWVHLGFPKLLGVPTPGNPTRGDSGISYGYRSSYLGKYMVFKGFICALELSPLHSFFSSLIDVFSYHSFGFTNTVLHLGWHLLPELVGPRTQQQSPRYHKTQLFESLSQGTKAPTLSQRRPSASYFHVHIPPFDSAAAIRAEPVQC